MVTAWRRLEVKAGFWINEDRGGVGLDRWAVWVMGQVVGLGLWCGDWWVSLDYLIVVLLGLGVVCGFVGGFIDSSNGDFF